MLPSVSNETPLRERNRRRTRRRIEDAATSLVVAHGFANVTVDDICRDAEISRRTFFNYMDSKDEAILGPSPMALSDDRREQFLAEPSDNLVRSALENIIATTTEAEDVTIEQGADEEFVATLRTRRHQILANEPAVAVMSLNRFREQSLLMRELITEHLTRHPGDRKLPDVPLDTEATIINGLIRESVWLHMTTPAFTSATERTRLLLQAGENITTLAKELTW